MLSSFIKPGLKVAVCVLALGAIAFGSGCTKKSKASSACVPPPQSLSEPVRLTEYRNETPAPAPVIHQDVITRSSSSVSNSEPLPVFTPPESKPMIRLASAPAPHAQFVPATASAASGKGTYHTLAKGETIYGLARTYKVAPKAILEANKFKDANHLAVGTKVLIPS